MTPRSFFYLILAFIISLPALKHDRLCRNNPTAAECVMRK